MTSTDEKAVLLEVSDLRKDFTRSEDRRRLPRSTDSSSKAAVRGVSFQLHESELLALVGESGCGKSTLLRCILGLIPITSGTISFKGVGYPAYLDKAGDRIQSVFQNVLPSLNPRMRVRALLDEPLRIHRFGDKKARRRRILELIEAFQLSSSLLDRFPEQISGGQGQRVGLARALATSPELLLADEPTSALDASLQVQVIRELLRIHGRIGFAMIFVTHDLALARSFCPSLAVMWKGKIVEAGDTEEIFRDPQHPYTRTLIEQAVA